MGKILCAVLALFLLACQEEAQTPCEKYVDRVFDCELEGTWDQQYYVDMCEANLDGLECDETCQDWQACSLECTDKDDCARFEDCLDDC